MGLPPIPTWKFILGVLWYCILQVPLCIRFLVLQEYKIACKKIKRARARRPLTDAEEKIRAAHEQQNRRHPFMKLPAELRMQIYEMCIPTDAVIIPQARSIYVTSKPTIYETEQSVARMLPAPEERDKEIQYPRYLRSVIGPLDTGYAARNARMANMSQVLRVWRGEALRFFYGHNIFKLSICEHFGDRGQDWGKGQRSLFWAKWLKRRPREALAVMTLAWHDLRECAHESANGWRSSKLQCCGDCVVVLSLREGLLTAKKDLVHPVANVVSCGICWNSFAKATEVIHDDLEFLALLAGVHEEFDTGVAAVKLVDRLDNSLLIEDCERGIRPDGIAWPRRFARSIGF